MAWTQKLLASGLIVAFAAACGEAPEPGGEAGTGAGLEAGGQPAAEVAEEGSGEPLVPIDRSGIRGSASLTLEDEEATIEVVVRDVSQGQRYTAAVHQGRCSGGGAIVLPLGDLTAGDDGVASTRTRVAGSALPAGWEVFVQVYDEADEAIACADLPAPSENAVPDDDAGDAP